MKKYLVYSTVDGDILRCGICMDEDFELQAEVGEAVMEHDMVDDVSYKVDLSTLEIVPVA